MVITQLPTQRAALAEERRDWWRSAACLEADPELFFPVSAHGPGAGEIARAKEVCAACREMDPELFFPVGARGPGAGEIDRAKAICAGCRVRRQCLQYALATHQMHGVWGGTTEDERQLRVRREREMEQRQRRKVTRPRGEAGGNGTRSRSGRIRSV